MAFTNDGRSIVVADYDANCVKVVRLEDGAITNSDGEPDASRCSDAIPV